MKVIKVFSKDFIETAEGLVFAVVDHGLEQGKVLCFLRYVLQANVWQKIATDAANEFLQQHYPEYLHYSSILDCNLHAVCTDRIVKHHQPKIRLQALLKATPADSVEDDLLQLCKLFKEHGLDFTQLGITGSVLIGVQNPGSDIDLVCYDREVFHQCRAITELLIQHNKLQGLNDLDWQQSYQRRSCALSFEDYVWHEQRKCNKAVINRRKFDLNFIDCSSDLKPVFYQKMGPVTLQCKVINDYYGFDYPAKYEIDHPQIGFVVSFTATYTGQALCGEMIEISGILEHSAQGEKHIVVGSSREAPGEYIKVLK